MLFSLLRRALDRLCSLGGVLGLALTVYVLRRWSSRPGNRDRGGDRGGSRPSGSRTRRTGQHQRSSHRQDDDGVLADRRRPNSSKVVSPGEVHGRGGDRRAGTSLPLYIAQRYKNPSMVVSIPSLLAVESGPISDAATAHVPTVEYLKAQLDPLDCGAFVLTSSASSAPSAPSAPSASSFATYLVCHVEDDVGEAVVRAMLEHCGLVPGVVPSHRVVFVGDAGSLVSVVRQLDPGVFVCSGGVAEEGVCAELRRFYKERGRIVRVARSGDDGRQSRLGVEVFLRAAAASSSSSS